MGSAWGRPRAHAPAGSPDARSLFQAYMEDHLKNKNRLEKEWEALCAYQAEPNSSLVAQREENLPKNRCPAVLTCTYLPAGGGGRARRCSPVRASGSGGRRGSKVSSRAHRATEPSFLLPTRSADKRSFHFFFWRRVDLMLR